MCKNPLSFTLLSAALLLGSVANCSAATQTKEKGKHQPRSIAGYRNETRNVTVHPRFIGVFVNTKNPSTGFLDFCGSVVSKLRITNETIQKGELLLGKLDGKNIYANKADLSKGSFGTCPFNPAVPRHIHEHTNATAKITFNPRLLGTFISQAAPTEGFLDFCGTSVSPVRIAPKDAVAQTNEVLIAFLGTSRIFAQQDRLESASFECGLGQESAGFDFPGR